MLPSANSVLLPGMCGRFGQISKAEKYARRFGLNVADGLDHAPNYNTDIGNMALIATSNHTLIGAMFGYTPDWSPKPMYLFNARAEGDFNPENNPDYQGPKGIFNKPSFRKVIHSQRAVVPVDYFVEGPETERLKKPFVVQRQNGEPFLLAGLFGQWTQPETGEVRHTFTIITTANSPLLGKVGHHRSPLVLAEKDLALWLNPATPKTQVAQLMIPFSDAGFEAIPVSAQMGRRNTAKSPNNSPDLLQPIGPAFTS